MRTPKNTNDKRYLKRRIRELELEKARLLDEISSLRAFVAFVRETVDNSGL